MYAQILKANPSKAEMLTALATIRQRLTLVRRAVSEGQASPSELIDVEAALKEQEAALKAKS